MSTPAPTARRIPRDAAGGAGVAILGLVYTLTALGIEPDPSSSSVVGPRVFPLLVGMLMFLGGIALAASALIRRKPAEAVPAGAERSPSAKEVNRRLVVIFGLLTVYVLLFIPLGYLLSTFAFVLGLSMFLARRRLLVDVVFAAAFPIAVYALFTYGLRVQLPPGVLNGILP